MPAGYHDRILKVNLTLGTWEIESPGEAFFRTYLGGRALIAYYMAKEMDLTADPLGPENLLIFAPGVVTGSTISGPGRNGVGAKSPLTGAFGSAEVGGFWGAELKRAGFDAIVVRGRSPEPVWLWIKDGQVELRSAAHLWGLTVGETEDQIREEMGDRGIRTAIIGPAGERLVRFANIVNDRSHFAGRGGLGAVMGAKNLKAIACRGPMGKTGLMEVQDPAGVARINKWLAQQGLPMVESLAKYGTAGGLLNYASVGNLPTHNYEDGSWEELQENLSGERMAETILKKRETCYACAVRCKRAVEIHEPHRVSIEYGGPEYETLAGLGSNCGIFDLAAVAKGSERCAALGIDSISCGMAISWAMECYQKGLLTGAETGGLKLEFGSAEVMLDLVEKIAAREGFGDLLAEGSLRAARTLGRGEELVVHVKGQEFPLHDPRTKHGLGLGFAVSPTGADHMHNLHDHAYTMKNSRWLNDARHFGEFSTIEIHGFSPEKLRLWNHHTTWRHALDSMVMCHFLPYNPQQMVEIINAVTGWEMDIFELHRVGQRASTMARAVNSAIGLRRDDDSLPPKMFKEVRRSKLGKPFSADELQAAITEVYRMNGWDPQTGLPTRERLAELGVEWVGERLPAGVV